MLDLANRFRRLPRSSSGLDPAKIKKLAQQRKGVRNEKLPDGQEKHLKAVIDAKGSAIKC